jgi:exosome complex RNA-binding protein Rrp42 (RNase PH superfamily)
LNGNLKNKSEGYMAWILVVDIVVIENDGGLFVAMVT